MNKVTNQKKKLDNLPDSKATVFRPWIPAPVVNFVRQLSSETRQRLTGFRT